MNTQKRTLSRRAEALAALCLIACLGALGLHAATQTTNFAPADATVGNARLLALAVTEYAQDSDEQLPPTHTVAEFQTALHPFVSSPAVFVSRVTGKPFIPNPAVSNRSLASFTAPDTTIVFRDTAAKATVGFLDGHIETGGIVQGDPRILSAANAQTLALGVLQYEQDNDEKFPPMGTQTEFKAAIYPFVQNPRFFIDPLNGKPFVPNPTLSGVPVASISHPRKTILLQSATPYSSGVPTVAYADGHVTPSSQPSSAQDAGNLQQIGQATEQFVQDNDETLPPTNDYGTFEAALAPYLNDSDIFVSPDSKLPYVLNTALSGVSVVSSPSPFNMEFARDAQLNKDGTLNHLLFPGYITQDQYFIPKSLAVSPDDLTYLLWPKASQQAAIWTIQSGDTTKYTETLGQVGNESNVSNATDFSVGPDKQTRLLWNNSYFPSVFSVPFTGGITLDILGTDGSLEASTQFGPYDGWTALLLATGADNNSRLLWQRYDGTLALWTLAPDDEYLGSVALPRLGGGTAVGLAIGTDGLTRLLWKTTRGTGKLWLIAETGRVVHSFEVPVPSGAGLTALSLGADGASRILESDSQGYAAVVTLRANGSSGGSAAFTLPGGGTAAQLAVGKAGDLRVLWEAADGSGKLQTLKANGQSVSVLRLMPYQ